MSNDKYKTTIGLEIHAELKTKTKMFCDSKNNPDEKKPNVNICPVCMAHPGTLPVINKEAVKHVLRVGRALGAKLADFTEFDRKNYFYPDIPKAYQISQYKYPLVSGGELAGVKITRVHLEEDTANSKHDNGEHSLVDFNRAGVPLMELVTEPVVESAEQAMVFAKELQLLLRYLGAGDANMEKGEMRVEANISVSKTDTFGTKVEVKNLNSFKIVAKAIEYEVARQIKVLESGEKIVQETRGWDEAKQKTFSQRIKESSDDYRYFPDPDLPKLKISEVEEFQNLELPELPWEKRQRYKKEFGIKDEDIESFITDLELANFFESAVKDLDVDMIKLASNYVTSDLIGLQQKTDFSIYKNIKPSEFAELIKMVHGGEISSRGAKDILRVMAEYGGVARKIAEEKELFQKSDEGELKKIVEQIIEENQKVADEYKAGKETAIKFLMGQGMRATKGSANPQVLEKIFVEVLSEKS